MNTPSCCWNLRWIFYFSRFFIMLNPQASYEVDFHWGWQKRGSVNHYFEWKPPIAVGTAEHSSIQQGSCAPSSANEELALLERTNILLIIVIVPYDSANKPKNLDFYLDRRLPNGRCLNTFPSNLAWPIFEINKGEYVANLDQIVPFDEREKPHNNIWA